MKKIRKFCISIVSMILIMALLTVNCFAYTGFTRTPLRGQETDRWCWAACCQMLLETQKIYLSQTQIAGGISGGATVSQILSKLNAYAPNIQWNYYNGGRSFDQIESTINAGWAICMLGIYIGTNGGHAMVITGYDRNPAGFNNIWLQDPWGNDNIAPHDGEEGWCNAAAPATGDYSNSIFLQCQNLVWNETIV